MKRRERKRPLQDIKEIVRDTAHIPDRDQMFETGNKAIPPVVEDRNGWSGEDEPRIEGRGDERDTVDALRTVERIVDRGEASPQPGVQLTPAGRAGGVAGGLASLSEAELRRRAEVLGVAGRESMTRSQLVRAMLESDSTT